MLKKNMNSIQIIPAILATTEEEYRNKLNKIRTCPELSEGWIQIDLMDKKFVQNKSIGVDIIAKYPTSLKKEAHLMVEYPENWIDELVKINMDRIIFPLEDLSGIPERIQHIKNHGIEVGLSINPKTLVAKVRPFLDKIDLLLIMSVQPGFGGQEFIQETIAKIEEAAALRQQGKFLIEVDGGINETVVKTLAEAGADNLVIGEYLINGDITENLEKIWQAF